MFQMKCEKSYLESLSLLLWTQVVGYFFSSIILSFPKLLLPLIVTITTMHPKQVFLAVSWKHQAM
jgi:hypothetical protein